MQSCRAAARVLDWKFRFASCSLAFGLAAAAAAPGCAPASPAPGPDVKVKEQQPAASRGTHRGVFKVVPLPGKPSGAESKLLKKDGPPTKRTLFVNRHGGTYQSGDDDSSQHISSIVSGVSTVPPYADGDASWAQFMACIRDQFSPFNVTVTDVDPGSTTHIEAVIGGTPGSVGMGQGVGGVAPMFGDCSIVERAIVFVFADVLGGAQTSCEVAAQEIGHAYGMDHEYLCEDPMTYLNGCGNKKFQDQTVSCGEDSPRACQCTATQNSVQMLLSRLGPSGGSSSSSSSSSTSSSSGGSSSGGGPNNDTTPPTVAVVTPDDGSTEAENSSMTVQAKATDDTALASVQLLWEVNGNTITMDCASPPSGITCNHAGDTFTWTFNVGSGARAFTIRATDTSGNVATTPSRKITLGSGGGGNPPPGNPPAVDIVSPSVGASFAPGDIVPLIVTATDDGSVDQVTVTWTAPSATVTYDLSPIDATTWEIDFDLSPSAAPGPRTLTVTAVDNQGNVTNHPPLVIQVQ